MANIWNGATPTGVTETQTYSLGSVIVALRAVTLNGIRVWSPANALTRTNRRGHVWDMSGNLLATITMTDALPSGWSTHLLDTPISLTAGAVRVISYETNGNYGSVTSAFASANHVSTDSAMMFPHTVAVASGNGRFTTTAGNFPTSTFGGRFYAVDADYTVASGTGPTVTGLSLTADGLNVTATITATDPDGLSGATYGIDWMDGSSSSGAAGVFTHTYSTGGVKPVLASVTDSTSLVGYRAGAIDLVAPAAGLAARELIDLLASHAAGSGLFDVVNHHEPKSAPGTGMNAAIWVDAIDPVRASGLGSTSLRFAVNVRLYTDMLREPQDTIDKQLAAAASALMAAYSADFSLGGQARSIDLLGAQGVPLSARAGYLNQDGKLFRVMGITVPIIVNDVWEQTP